MKFSIIVPVYNVEKYITKCLDSILYQNYEDYEVIAVNDGSTDNSLSILEEYRNHMKKLKIISQKNKGLGGARNTGILNAKGEYLVFLDSDDYVEPNMLSTLSKYIDLHNVDILAFDMTRVDTNGKIIERQTLEIYDKLYNEISLKEFFLFEPTSCTKIYKRHLFQNNDISFPERLWYEDLATIFKLIPFVDKIGYLKISLYNYVQQSESITHSTNINRIMEIKEAFQLEVDFFRKINLFDQYYAELEWNGVLHVLYYSAYRLFKSGYNFKEMNQLYSYIFDLFPNYKNNIYVKSNLNTKYLFDLIINKNTFLFYLKLYKIPSIKYQIKKIIKKD